MEVYFGETVCQALQSSGSKCPNKAYYRQGKQFLCGVHSKINKRTKLPRNPHAKELKEEALAAHQRGVDQARKRNKACGQKGQVVCSRLGMMKNPEDIEGFQKVFPNHKHLNRKDGFGCSSLSPKCLGPVHHLQKGLPPANLLENYHQFNKVFPKEVDGHNNPTQKFYSIRKSGYLAKVPFRHKPQATEKGSHPGKNKTLYSLHSDSKGKEKRYTYIQSRYLYCHFYEVLTIGNPDLARLHQMVADGTNIQIVGYDSFPMDKDIMGVYEDTKHPFGHERCLYALLTIPDPKDYPWNKYYETHKDLYPVELAPEFKTLKEEKKSEEEK